MRHSILSLNGNLAKSRVSNQEGHRMMGYVTPALDKGKWE
jgi:hypothetical protein